MIARIQNSMAAKKEDDKGFTLIELLVVIIIIGILAAIAIPVFLNQRQKAVDTGIKSDLRTVANEIESFYVDNQKYPAGPISSSVGTPTTITVPSSSASAEVAIALSDDATVVTYTLVNADNYTITGVNATKGTKATWKYDNSKGGLQDTPTAP